MTAMFAPSRFPPCVTRVDTEDRCLRTATGPHALPWVVLMWAPLRRSSDSAKPVPPPNFCTMAASCAAPMMPSMLSLRGNTKQADNVPAPVPAFISVGEFRQVLQGGHDLVEPLGRFFDLLVIGAVPAVRLGQGVGDATKHAEGVLRVFAVLAFSEVAFLDYDPRVFGQFGRPEGIAGPVVVSCHVLFSWFLMRFL